MDHRRFLPGLRRAARLGLLLAGAWAGHALAVHPPIAEAPLFTSASELVPPNIHFILDNSSSMKREYLPEVATDLNNHRALWYGFHSSQCNGLAYDPGTRYDPPVDHKGAFLPPGSTSFEDPATLSQQRTLSTAAGAITLPMLNTSGWVTLTPGQTWLAVNNGEPVTIFQDKTRYYEGIIVTRDGDEVFLVYVTKVVGVPGTPLSAPKLGLGSTQPFYFRYTGTQPRLSYTYAGNWINESTQFYRECTMHYADWTPGSYPAWEVRKYSGRMYTSLVDNNVAQPGTDGTKWRDDGLAPVAPFVRVDVTSVSAEAQNYANWRAYYRTRLGLMKAAVSHAFKDVNDRYRVGFTTINHETLPQNFLDIKPFALDANGVGHKKDFYDRLLGVEPMGDTPLRLALSRAGKYYANRMPGQTHDPIQYSCQRNYAVLSSDGHWNDPTEPTKLDGTTPIGDEDRDLPRPMYDPDGKRGTLADVAAYYYRSDLRDTLLGNCLNGEGRDVCEDNVPGTSADAFHSFGDTNARQHMTTFTLGLGVSGRLNYRSDYLTSTIGDFADIVRGGRDWPHPAANDPGTVDDLWHAAVNGRGQYFNANDPAALTRSLDDLLNRIRAVTGGAAAAATSSLFPVTGDDDVYVGQFTTQQWTGDLKAYKIDPVTAAIAATPTWSAAEQLDAMDYTQRRILFKQRDANVLQAFTYANLKASNYHGLFDNFCGKVINGAKPKQCNGLTDLQETVVNSGAALVDYLAGNHSPGVVQVPGGPLLPAVYRQRQSRLGDIVNASPLFVGKPAFKYLENDYKGFAATHANRQPVVLTGANDGMLHAFDAKTGRELWAYVPTFVLGKMFRLADTGYPSRHTYLVDGTPQVGDIYVAGKGWRTIVVGGLGAGGRGYYALDVTDPANPAVLWEFEDRDLGLTFGNPIITKRADGTWVVAFASGYNNAEVVGDSSSGSTPNRGDGRGHLFVLDAYKGPVDGRPMAKISTSEGTWADPSGLARINSWVPTEQENLALRFYGGDLKGNLWRFDLDGTVGAAGTATLLAKLTDPNLGPQPITTKPALGEVTYNGTKYPVVYVGTGRYLGLGDLEDTQTQSIYAIKDKLISTGHGVVRGHAEFVQRSIAAGRDADAHNTRSGAARAALDWATRSGWYLDFPVGGERVTVNPQMALETLYLTGNVPNADICDAGGESFLYEIDFNTGFFTAQRMGDFLVVGDTLVQLTQSGPSQGSIVNIVAGSDGKLRTIVGMPNTGAGTLRRTSWREMVD